MKRGLLLSARSTKLKLQTIWIASFHLYIWMYFSVTVLLKREFAGLYLNLVCLKSRVKTS